MHLSNLEQPGVALPIHVALDHWHRLVRVEVDQYLEKSLPVYMIPQAFVVVDEFPRTLNGKVDRCALPSPESPDRTKAVGPRDELETTLVRIWETVLPVRPIGVTDNLFDLGGHSLRAASLVSALRKDLELRHISMLDVYNHPTIRRLAAHLEATRPKPGSSRRCPFWS